MTSDDPESPEARPRDPWPALALLTIAVVAWFGFQTFQLTRERSALQAARVSQEPTIAQAQRIRGQLDSVTKSTLELAQQGNASAAYIVEELARRGVRINPASPMGSTGPAPAPPK
jgi:hypothetical protein